MCALNRVIEFVPQMQHAPLQINDHQVIRRRTSESLSDFFFEGFVPPLKISNVSGLRHVLWKCSHQIFLRRGARAKGV